jgi:2-(1,2-epoxy-1,2-dihydrophenyl)acetyl-CoA isomerase
MTNIFYQKTGKTATITLNRPEVFHALNAGLMTEVKTALDQAATDTDVRAIVLTGSGDRAFCSGADLKDMGSVPFSAKDRLNELYHPMIRAIRNCPKPVICKLNGLAAGAGFSLALACDLIVAREDTYVSLLFVGIGLMPDAGANYIVPRIVGSRKAFELASTGRKVYMEEAVQLGLVNKAVPADQLDAAVATLTDYYENAPTAAIAAMKQAIAMSHSADLETVLSYEAEQQDVLSRSEDFYEGVTAFLQKRPAKFKGK